MASVGVEPVVVESVIELSVGVDEASSEGTIEGLRAGTGQRLHAGGNVDPVAVYVALVDVVPADDKENARLIVSQIILDALEGPKMNYPKTNAKRRQELQAIRKRLAK